MCANYTPVTQRERMKAFFDASLFETFPDETWPGYAALGYVSMFSMLIGFFFWYRGLAQGGIAAVGQLQLLQPFCGLALASHLLGERIAPTMGLAALAVMVCVFGAKRYGR